MLAVQSVHYRDDRGIFVNSESTPPPLFYPQCSVSVGFSFVLALGPHLKVASSHSSYAIGVPGCTSLWLRRRRPHSFDKRPYIIFSTDNRYGRWLARRHECPMYKGILAAAFYGRWSARRHVCPMYKGVVAAAFSTLDCQCERR